MTPPGNPSTRARHADAAPEASMPKEQEPAEHEPEPAEPAAPKPKDKRRAGRNLPAAIGVGVALGGAVLASLFVCDPGVPRPGRGRRRRRHLGDGPGRQRAQGPPAAGAAARRRPVMVVLAWFGGADALPLGLLATLLVDVGVAVRRRGPGLPARRHRRRADRGLRAVPGRRSRRCWPARPDGDGRPRAGDARSPWCCPTPAATRPASSRQAPDGALGQPEEVLGGLRRVAGGTAAGSAVPAAARCSTSPGGTGPSSGSRSRSPRCSATWASR